MSNFKNEKLSRIIQKRKMFIMISIYIIASLVIVNAQDIIVITSSIGDKVFTAGVGMAISWTNQNKNKNLVSVQLVEGSPTNLAKIAIIVSNISASSQSFTWSIPTNITTGSDYVISIGNASNIYYSHYFTIQSAPSTTSVSSTASLSSSTTATATARSNSLNTTSIAGIVVGAVLGIIVIFIGSYIVYKRKKESYLNKIVIKQHKPDVINPMLDYKLETH